MENALTGIIIIGVMILAVFGLSEGALSAQANLAEASRAMQERLNDQARTALEVSARSSGLGNTVYITVTNTGSIKLADFNHWDVIVNDSAGHAIWYAYGTGLGTWSQITQEKFEPGILNPGETMSISVLVQFSIVPSSINVAAISTPNGLAVSVPFVGQP